MRILMNNLSRKDTFNIDLNAALRMNNATYWCSNELINIECNDYSAELLSLPTRHYFSGSNVSDVVASESDEDQAYCQFVLRRGFHVMKTRQVEMRAELFHDRNDRSLSILHQHQPLINSQNQVVGLGNLDLYLSKLPESRQQKYYYKSRYEP